jgi:hypothetical protein
MALATIKIMVDVPADLKSVVQEKCANVTNAMIN